MREPNPKNLKFDEAETKYIRQLAASKERKKITINLDGGVLDFLKKEALNTGVPYQKLLNVLLIEAIDQRKKAPSRLDKIEDLLATLTAVVNSKGIPRREKAPSLRRHGRETSKGGKPKKAAAAR